MKSIESLEDKNSTSYENTEYKHLHVLWLATGESVKQIEKFRLNITGRMADAATGSASLKKDELLKEIARAKFIIFRHFDAMEALVKSADFRSEELQKADAKKMRELRHAEYKQHFEDKPRNK